jgi:hypothetical protein
MAAARVGLRLMLGLVLGVMREKARAMVTAR